LDHLAGGDPSLNRTLAAAGVLLLGDGLATNS
jgi:hypothetical protein